MDKHHLKPNKSFESIESKIIEAFKNRQRYASDGHQVKAVCNIPKVATNKEENEIKKKTDKKSFKNVSYDNTSISSDSCSSVEFEWKNKNQAFNITQKNIDALDLTSTKKIFITGSKESESMTIAPNKIDKSASFENINRFNIPSNNLLIVSRSALEVHSDTRNKSPINLCENHLKYRKRNRSRTAANAQNDESSSDYDDCSVNNLVRYHSDETLNRVNSKIKLRTQRYYQRKSHEFITHPISKKFKKLAESKPNEQFSKTESLSSPLNSAKPPPSFITFNWVESKAYSSKDKLNINNAEFYNNPNEVKPDLNVQHNQQVKQTKNTNIDFECFDDIQFLQSSNFVKENIQKTDQNKPFNTKLSITTATPQPIVPYFSPNNDSGVSSQSLASSPVLNLPPSPPFRKMRHQLPSLNSSIVKNHQFLSDTNSSNQLIKNQSLNNLQNYQVNNIFHLPPSFPIKSQNFNQQTFPPEKCKTIRKSQRLSVKDMVANIEKDIQPLEKNKTIKSTIEANSNQHENSRDIFQKISSSSKIQNFSNALSHNELEKLRQDSSNAYNFAQNNCIQKSFDQKAYFKQNCYNLNKYSFDNNACQSDDGSNKKFSNSYDHNTYNLNCSEQNNNNFGYHHPNDYVLNGYDLNGYGLSSFAFSECNNSVKKINNSELCFKKNYNQNNFNNIVKHSSKFHNGYNNQNKKLIQNNLDLKPCLLPVTNEIESNPDLFPPLKLPPTILNMKTCSKKLDKFLENANYQPHPNKRYSNLDEAINDLEKIYESLNLNDEDLLEKAERRDMPSKFQLMKLNSNHAIRYNQNSNDFEKVSNKSKFSISFQSKSPKHEKYDSQSFLKSVEAFLASNDSCNRYRTPPLRRSAVHDRVKDDLAYRKLNLNLKKYKINSNIGNQTSSYLLHSKFYTPTIEVEEVFKDFNDEPDIAKDDLSYRKIIQSDGASVLPPHPPFGIPIGVTKLSTFNNYIRANIDPKEKKQIKPKKPHLIKDDLAYRNYRNDVKNKNDIEGSNSPLLPVTTQHILNNYKNSFFC